MALAMKEKRKGRQYQQDTALGVGLALRGKRVCGRPRLLDRLLAIASRGRIERARGGGRRLFLGFLIARANLSVERACNRWRERVTTKEEATMQMSMLCICVGANIDVKRLFRSFTFMSISLDKCVGIDTNAAKELLDIYINTDTNAKRDALHLRQREIFDLCRSTDDVVVVGGDLVMVELRFGLQFSMRNPQVVVLSVSLPIPPPEAIFFDGLPFGAIEAIKAAYGAVAQILDPPKDGYNLTMKLNLSKLPSDEGSTRFLCKVIMSLL
ncbi:hypothetical protein B296_00012434 [Ensete ventricosum]|uniref:Uncharacterized protein n=1 Tax=Ensete ventricosum TaxID=4639 RepID=A0A426ZAK3_ENSVE|nr:hypothetical protein B296_00012434 [Ensete ventricosum]